MRLVRIRWVSKNASLVFHVCVYVYVYVYVYMHVWVCLTRIYLYAVVMCVGEWVCTFVACVLYNSLSSLSLSLSFFLIHTHVLRRDRRVCVHAHAPSGWRWSRVSIGRSSPLKYFNFTYLYSTSTLRTRWIGRTVGSPLLAVRWEKDSFFFVYMIFLYYMFCFLSSPIATSFIERARIANLIEKDDR